jgi:uncharacterized membrane protein YsdA (DUF1294 family)
MIVLLLVVAAVALFVFLLVIADRAAKAIERGRRRREVGERLAAVTAEAEARHKRRKAAAEASGALTSVMPTIHDLETRRVE